MSLAANDAFSLGLAHNGPRRRPLTRSSSPKISTALFPQSTQNKGRPNVRRRMIRRLSNLQPVAAEVIDEIQENNRELRQPSRKEIKRLTSETREKSPATVDWEIPRKTLHSSIGFVTIYLYVSDESPRHIVLGLCAALAVIIPADLLRFRSSRFERLYESQLGFLMRDSEKTTPNGVIWYILGVIFSLTVYPTDVAVVAILILAWADTAASTFGRLFGSRTPPLPHRLPLLRLPLAPRKSLAGFVAASVTAALAAVCFWKFIAPCRPNDLSWQWDGGINQSTFGRSDWFTSILQNAGIKSFNTGGWLGLGVIGVVAGVVAGVAEALDLPFDDNLTLPIISGGFLFGFFKILGLFSS